MNKFSFFILDAMQVVSRKRQSLQDYDSAHVTFWVGSWNILSNQK